MSYLEKKLKFEKIFAELPKKIKDVIDSNNPTDEIFKMCDLNNFSFDEIGNIYDEISSVILGETRPENFVENIHSALIDENKDKAAEIASEINNKILNPIREAYKQTSTGNLIPDPQEKPLPAEPTGELGSEINILNLQNRINPQDENKQETLNRDFIMREIENPTPAEIFTARIPMDQKFDMGNTNFAEPPANLPIKNTEVRISQTQNEVKENAVLRTMAKDVVVEQKTFSANQTNQSSIFNKGKFGLGTPPPLKQEIENNSVPTIHPPAPPHPNTDQKNIQVSVKPSFIPHKPGLVGGSMTNIATIQNPPVTAEAKKPEQPAQIQKPSELPPVKNVLETNQKTNPSIFGNSSVSNQQKIIPTPTSIPQVTTQKTTFQIPKTNTVNDVVDDKLVKTVNVPSERKRYVVDPYREPLE